MTTITENEKAMLTALVESDFASDGTIDGAIGHPVWSFDPCEAFGTSAGGIAGSLVKKGLIDCSGPVKGDGSTMELTEKGAEVLRASGWKPGLTP